MTASRGLPRPAASVVLLRDGDAGVEVFMERRHLATDFVGGAYVFPGGRVDAADRLGHSLSPGLDDASASARLGVEGGGLAFWVAAVRECFEEAGILFAYDAEGELLDLRDPESARRFAAHRDALNRGELSIGALAESEGLTLATDRMLYWSHWITPEGMPKRYDTRFFVAEVPPGQTAVHDDGELTSSAWVRPAEAIERALARQWTMILPTLKNLEELARFDSAEEAVAAGRARSEVPCIVPRVLERDGEARVVLPGDDGYDEAPRDASGAGREVWEPTRLVASGLLSRPTPRSGPATGTRC